MVRFLLVVLVFAAVVYWVMWSMERRRTGSGVGPGLQRPRREARRETRRAAAPDDDEDFLRWLDRKRRKDSPGG